MATIDTSRRPLVMLGSIVVVHIALISAQVNSSAGIPIIQVVTFGAFAEIQRGTMKSIDGVRGLWSGYVALRDVRAENEALRRELQSLQVQLQAERAEASRTEGLRQLLDLQQRAGLDTTAAEIIASAPDLEFRTLTIDKGVADGLAPDMAVIAPAGIVGRVILPSRRAAKVQMIIDPNAAAGALIERTRAQGVVVGQGSGLRMDYVPATADVKAGDVVVTSGIDGIYPKGFVIGTVTSTDRGAGTYYLITVQPSVDFSRLEEVLVVTSPVPGKEGAAAPEPPGAGGPRE